MFCGFVVYARDCLCTGCVGVWTVRGEGGGLVMYHVGVRGSMDTVEVPSPAEGVVTMVVRSVANGVTTGDETRGSSGSVATLSLSSKGVEDKYGRGLLGVTPEVLGESSRMSGLLIVTSGISVTGPYSDLDA